MRAGAYFAERFNSDHPVFKTAMSRKGRFFDHNLGMEVNQGLIKDGKYYLLAAKYGPFNICCLF